MTRSHVRLRAHILEYLEKHKEATTEELTETYTKCGGSTKWVVNMVAKTMPEVTYIKRMGKRKHQGGTTDYNVWMLK